MNVSNKRDLGSEGRMVKKARLGKAELMGLNLDCVQNIMSSLTPKEIRNLRLAAGPDLPLDLTKRAMYQSLEGSLERALQGSRVSFQTTRIIPSLKQLMSHGWQPNEDETSCFCRFTSTQRVKSTVVAGGSVVAATQGGTWTRGGVYNSDVDFFADPYSSIDARLWLCDSNIANQVLVHVSPFYNPSLGNPDTSGILHVEHYIDCPDDNSKIRTRSGRLRKFKVSNAIKKRCFSIQPRGWDDGHSIDIHIPEGSQIKYDPRLFRGPGQTSCQVIVCRPDLTPRQLIEGSFDIEVCKSMFTTIDGTGKGVFIVPPGDAFDMRTSMTASPRPAPVRSVSDKIIQYFQALTEECRRPIAELISEQNINIRNDKCMLPLLPWGKIDLVTASDAFSLSTDHIVLHTGEGSIEPELKLDDQTGLIILCPMCGILNVRCKAIYNAARAAGVPLRVNPDLIWIHNKMYGLTKRMRKYTNRGFVIDDTAFLEDGHLCRLLPTDSVRPDHHYHWEDIRLTSRTAFSNYLRHPGFVPYRPNFSDGDDSDDDDDN